MTLQDLGWTEELENAFAPFREKSYLPARLIRETSINFSAMLAGGEELDAILCGRLWNAAPTDADLPAVGDWVAIQEGSENDPHVIRAQLPRRSAFSRKMPGNSSQPQVIGANIDIVTVVTDPGPDWNIRRLERYLTLIHRSGAKAVILINKSDLFEPELSKKAAEELQKLAPKASIHITSALRGEGLAAIQGHLSAGITMCIVGSSGVGKSTLVNQLYGEEWQFTSHVNETTGKGRHTTTARELVPLETGGLLIDNPGMREIQMWTDENILRGSFEDIARLTDACKFSDCSHIKDAGCAIRDAVNAGSLDPSRYESFLNLEAEIATLQARAKKRQMAVERWHKRNHRVKARNLADRIQLEKDKRGDI